MSFIIQHVHGQGRSYRGGEQFYSQTLGILLFMGVQKLHGPEMPQFLKCIPQLLENSLTFFLTTEGK